MQPRTGKGPSWANEPQLRPQTSAKKSDEVGVKDDQMDDEPAPSQDALSDLEWMRRRMANSVTDHSDATAHRLDSSPTTKADMEQVRSRNAIHPTPCHLIPI